MRLLIGSPTADGRVHGHYTQSLLRASHHLVNNKVEVIYHLVRGHDLGLNRCSLLYAAIHYGADYLLQVDTDLGFPEDAPWRLLQWRKEMISIPYVGRHLHDGGSFEVSGAVEVQADPPLLKVESCGAGFLMTSRAWNEIMWSTYPNAVFQFIPDPKNPGNLAKYEDYIACERWRSLGGEIFADPTPRLHHYGEYCFSASMLDVAEGAKVPLPPENKHISEFWVGEKVGTPPVAAA